LANQCYGATSPETPPKAATFRQWDAGLPPQQIEFGDDHPLQTGDFERRV